MHINTKHKIVVSHWEDDYITNLEHNDNVSFILKPYDEVNNNIYSMNDEAVYMYDNILKKLINEDTETKEILA